MLIVAALGGNALLRRGEPLTAENQRRNVRIAAGSMGPKVEAACRFARATGKRAAIGELADLERTIAGKAGTTISTEAEGIVYAARASDARGDVPRSQKPV